MLYVFVVLKHKSAIDVSFISRIGNKIQCVC